MNLVAAVIISSTMEQNDDELDSQKRSEEEQILVGTLVGESVLSAQRSHTAEYMRRCELRPNNK